MEQGKRANEGVRRPPDAGYIGWGDADVFHRQPGWAREAVEHLQHYRVIQTWTRHWILGPTITARGACALCAIAICKPAGGRRADVLEVRRRPLDYPQAATLGMQAGILDWTGGLFELGGMGRRSPYGPGPVGRSEVVASGPVWPTAHLTRWQDRARRYVNGRIGAVPGIVDIVFMAGSRIAVIRPLENVRPARIQS